MSTVAEVLEIFAWPRIRGPFPHPAADDLANPAYLHALAQWGRAAALRSRRTLGDRGVQRVLEAAARLHGAADRLAAEAPRLDHLSPTATSACACRAESATSS